MNTAGEGSTSWDDLEKNEIFLNNLDALAIHHPELEDKIESLDMSESGFKLLGTESGDLRLLHRNEQGEEVYIHSAGDPAGCANQAIDLLGKMEKEGIAVLFGFGLGYFAEEIMKRFEAGHILIVYEATPALLKAALMARDLTEIIKSDKLRIILGEGDYNLSILHTHHNLIANGKFWVVKHHPSAKLNEPAYDNFFKILNDEKRLSDSGVATAIGLGKTFVDTLMENVPYILRNPGVSKLKDAFKGRPAIIISAGPSLNKNLHLINKSKGKAVIIAVDAVLPTILPAGVIPDLVVAIDPLEGGNILMYKDNPVLKDVPFICLAQYTPKIVNMYPGPIFINSVNGNVVYNWLAGFWEDKGIIDCFGGSVAHLAFGTAEFLGCEVIAMVGQDLSYKKEVHSKGFSDLSYVQMEGYIKDNFKKMPSNLKWAIPVIKDAIKKGENPLDYFNQKTQGKKTVDIFNDSVFTRDDFLAFKTSFEKKIKTFKGQVFNATEGGLPIEGATSIRVIDFIDEYCNMEPMDSLAILSDLGGSVAYNLDGLAEEVSAAWDKLTEIKGNANTTLKYIKKLNALKKNNQHNTDEFHNILTKVEAIIEEIKHPVLNALITYNYGLELYMKSQSATEIDEMEDEWEKLDKQLERGKKYYGELVRTIDLFNKQLASLKVSLKREKEVNRILSEENKENSGKYVEIAKRYKADNMTGMAVKYFEMARANSNEKGLELFLAELYVKQFRFREALDLLEKVSPDERKMKEKAINDLVKECNLKLNSWDEKKRKLGSMLEDAEKEYGSNLESGYFYFRINDFERAEKSYEKAVKENEADKGLVVESYYGLAHSYLAAEKVEDAFETLEKAIEIEPENPVLYRDMGLIAFQNNNLEPAELFLLKAIELAPNEVTLYKPLAELYMSLGSKEKAIALYEIALESNPDNPVLQQDLAVVLRESIKKSSS